VGTEEVEGPRSPDEIRSSIEEKMDYLMSSNSSVVALLRGRANMMNELAERYIDLAHTSATVAGELAELALETSQRTGDLLIAEFGSEVEVRPEDYEEDDDDDD
jgi:hypothetical protein